MNWRYEKPTAYHQAQLKLLLGHWFHGRLTVDEFLRLELRLYHSLNEQVA